MAAMPMRLLRSCLLAIFALCASLAPFTSARAEETWQSAVGKAATDFGLADYRGKKWSLADFRDNRIVVVSFLGTECPLMGQYGPRLAELAAKYEAQGVAFVGINANQQ